MATSTIAPKRSADIILHTETAERIDRYVPSGCEIVKTLRRTGVPELYALDYELIGEEVVLRGTVGSYYLKQRAQTAVLDVPGVRRVRNQLQVRRELLDPTKLD